MDLIVLEFNKTVVNFCISGIFHPRKHILNLSLKIGIFPNGKKTARGLSIFKKDAKFFCTNHRPILVFPCFSKLLERLMYSRLYIFCKIVFSWRGDVQPTLHLLQNNINYEKQFGFQASN